MAGDVWEWTSSPFRPYPGFVAFPGPECSEVNFGDDLRVLRGGSWATDGIVARASLRRFEHPARREIFAGFPELDVKRYGISVGAGHHFLAKSGHVANILVECHNTFDLDRAWPIVTITFSATVLRI